MVDLMLTSCMSVPPYVQTYYVGQPKHIHDLRVPQPFTVEESQTLSRNITTPEPDTCLNDRPCSSSSADADGMSLKRAQKDQISLPINVVDACLSGGTVWGVDRSVAELMRRALSSLGGVTGTLCACGNPICESVGASR